MEQVARDGYDYEHDYYTQRRCHHGVDPRRCLHAVQIEQREHRSEEDRPGDIRYSVYEILRCLATPDRADQRIQDVIHRHAPAGQITEAWTELAAHVHEGRAALRICARHSSIADGGEQHGDHRAEDRRHYMPVRLVVDDAEAWHRSGRLNEDDAVEHQVPIAKTALERNLAGAEGRFGRHLGSSVPATGYFRAQS